VAIVLWVLSTGELAAIVGGCAMDFQFQTTEWANNQSAA